MSMGKTSKSPHCLLSKFSQIKVNLKKKFCMLRPTVKNFCCPFALGWQKVVKQKQ